MIIVPTHPPTIVLKDGESLPGFLNILGTVVLRSSPDGRKIRIIKNSTDILPTEFISVPEHKVLDTDTDSND